MVLWVGRTELTGFGGNGFCVEIVDRDGKSSLLSLVKAFDSVLAVYEGFCNLKQVHFLSAFCFFFSLFWGFAVLLWILSYSLFVC